MVHDEVDTGVHPEEPTEAPTDDRLFIKWLKARPAGSQEHLAQVKFDELLLNAAQPLNASGNGCIRLCYYTEQCMSSKSPPMESVAFSSENCTAMFNFYIDCNEKTQSRSMRQVLDLVSSLIAKNPDPESVTAVRASILGRCLSIISHQAAVPLVKPAFKSLEFLIGKRTITTQQFFEAYGKQRIGSLPTSASGLRDEFFLEVFDWMMLADVAPAAGKFLVTIFKQIRSDHSNLTDDVNIVSWQRWIRAGLNKDPRALENVKNYILLPLFKVDRPGSLILLEELSNQGTVTEPKVQDLDCHSLLQLAAIEVGKKSGLIEEPNTVQFKAPKKCAATVALQEDAISGLLSNASDTVRSLAFSVMVSSSSPIRPFTAFALETLRLYLPSLYSDTDAKFRNEVLSNSKHMIDRLRGSTGFLVRELDSIDARAKRGTRDNQSHIVSHAAACLSIHKEFIEWYFKFLLEELIPTTSYQRHITALKATELLLHSGVLKHDGSQPPPQKADNDTVWPFHIDFFTPISMRLLLDLLMDPFEDVRSGATAILKLASPRDFMIKSIKTIGKDNNIHYTENLASLKGEVSKIGSIGSGESLELLQTFISRAEDDSRRTGRADYADGVARSCDLLYALQRSKESRLSLLIRLVDDLETKVEIAEQGLGQAVLEAPVHGTFAALSLVWDSINRLDDFGLSTDENYAEVQLEALPQRIADLCRRIWTAVKEILCNDSPEGHLPQDLDEVEIVDTKDLLSYSFRAIHESSNLMRTIVNKIANGSKDRPPLVSARVFAQIGDLTFDQLSSLRHRGAFSTVSLTFARCCILTQLQASAIGGLLGKWYNGALDCIFEQASTTRRSAGIPALLTGIMTANSKNPAFEDIVGKLKWIARQPAHQSATDETNLPQVHAMNSLKETFRSSILGRRAENHIGECLQISVESLKSEIWAIRNCGLLLLRSLIDCLFGTSDSKTAIEAGWDGKSIKISYDKYPALPELLVKLLSEEVSHGAQSSPDISTVESVFPALDIVRRAGPPSSHRHEIYRLVMTHLGSKVWNVREMAAHTLSVLAPQDRWAATARELLETQRASHNLRHGSLMALKFILERQSAIDANAAMGALTEIIPAFASSWDDDCTTDCPEILTAHIEARNAVGLLLASKVERSGFIPPESTRHHLSLFGPGPLDNFFNMTEPGSKFEHWHPASIALARRAVCNIFLREDYLQLTHVFKWAMGLGTDVILAALTFISGSKFAQGCQDLPGLCQAYVSTINSFDSSEVRAAALDELFGALSTGLGDKKSGVDVVFSTLLELADFLHQPRNESPSLQNAQLQMSGWLLLADIYFIGNDPNQVSDIISYWTSTLSLAGRKTEDFDTRYAAALALSSFYTSIQHLSDIPSRILLPCHLAMYDCLNDDDSEIRELAAKALPMWKSQSLIPVAAQKSLAESIIKDCHSHPLLSWNIISRMTGSLEIVLSQNHNLDSPATMFQAALNVDNTLFVEEDQNLYIDEVREVKFWGDVLDKFLFHKKLYERDDRHTPLDKAPISALISWTGNAIKVLNTIDQQDGVLGWTSKPPAFSACMRTIICASALLKLSLGSEILEKPFFSIENGQLEVITSELATFVANASKVRLHGSLLAELNARLPASSRHIFGTEDSDFSYTLERI